MSASALPSRSTPLGTSPPRSSARPPFAGAGSRRRRARRLTGSSAGAPPACPGLRPFSCQTVGPQGLLGELVAPVDEQALRLVGPLPPAAESRSLDAGVGGRSPD